MKKIIFAVLTATLMVLASCVKDVKPEIEQGNSPVVLNEAYSNGGRSTFGDIDWVELYNTSEEPADVSNFVLSDKADMAEKVTLPANTIIPAKDFLLVEVDIIGGFGLGSGGDMVYMYDTEGKLVDNIQFPALAINESYARVPDGSNDYKIQTPTPGTSNNSVTAVPLIADVTRVPLAPTSEQSVDISATVTSGAGTLQTVTLKWKVNDVAKADIPMILDGTVYKATIAAQAVGAVVEYTIYAQNSEGGEISSTPATYTVRDATVVDYTGLVINEIDGNGKFIELYNGGTNSISLSGVLLIKNEVAAEPWWTGGTSANIAPNGYYVISNGEDAGVNADETNGAGGISPKKNVKFELKAPDATLLDQFTRSATVDLDATTLPDYGSGTKYSFSRCPDGVGAFGLAVPSSKTANPFKHAGAIVTEEATVLYTDLVINEVDGNGKFIELYNNGTTAISLKDVTIVKNLQTAAADIWWTGGEVNIPAGGRYTIAEAGSGTTAANEETGNGGISPKKTLRFDLVIGNLSLDIFARVKSDNVLDASCTPDYAADPPYSFSRCADGVGAFGLAAPSCNAANPATAVGPIVTN